MLTGSVLVPFMVIVLWGKTSVTEVGTNKKQTGTRPCRGQGVHNVAFCFGDLIELPERKIYAVNVFRFLLALMQPTHLFRVRHGSKKFRRPSKFRQVGKMPVSVMG